MIPKVINYCWFGYGEKPNNFEKIISSWKKYCPDYQIIEWNEKNYDVNANEFIKNAYLERKFAFVSDFARLDIINKFGGIYVDVDVEFLKSIDSIIARGPFFATEEIDRINTGLIFGAEKDDSILKSLIKIYSEMDREQAIKSLNYTNTVDIVTAFFKKKGFKFNGRRQLIDNHTIYETKTFCPQQFGEKVKRNDNNAYTTHHYNSSWVSENKWSLEKQYRHARISRRIKKYFGIHVYKLIFKIYSPLFGRGSNF